MSWEYHLHRWPELPSPDKQVAEQIDQELIQIWLTDGLTSAINAAHEEHGDGWVEALNSIAVDFVVDPESDFSAVDLADEWRAYKNEQGL